MKMSSVVAANVSRSMLRKSGIGFGGGPALTGGPEGGVFGGGGPFASGVFAGAAGVEDGFLLFWLLIETERRLI